MGALDLTELQAQEQGCGGLSTCSPGSAPLWAAAPLGTGGHPAVAVGSQLHRAVAGRGERASLLILDAQEERGPPLPASLAHTGASRQRGVGVIAAGACLQGEGRGELVGLWNAHGMEGETGLADKQGPVIILLIFNGPSCLVELSCPGVGARLGLFLLGPCP